MIPTKPIRVLSERIMSRGFEPTVGRLMENVQKVVRRQPGLLSVETLSDMNDHHKYVVLSEVRLHFCMLLTGVWRSGRRWTS